ncbi:MAG: hypothetical protein RIG62_18215 [Cyclobacteriaceae bacterium]
MPNHRLTLFLLERVLFWLFAISVVFLADPIEIDESPGWLCSLWLPWLGYMFCILLIQRLIKCSLSLLPRLVAMVVIGFVHVSYVVAYSYVTLPLVGVENNASWMDIILRTAIMYYIIGFITYVDSTQSNTILKLNRASADECFQKNFLASQFDFHLSKNVMNLLLEKAYTMDAQMAIIIETYSEILIRSLNLKPDQKISLLEEISFIDTYIQLNRLISPKDFYIESKKCGRFHHHRVYPRLVFPLVENAILHGVTNLPDHPIQIQFKSRDDYFECHIENRIKAGSLGKSYSTGLGRSNLMDTLDRYYPEQYMFNEHVNDQVYHTVLKIKLNDLTTKLL